jgi:hypothetical protein
LRILRGKSRPGASARRRIGANRATNTAFTFSGIAPAAGHDTESISGRVWQSDEAVDVAQAHRIYDQAMQMGADKVNPTAMRDAEVALGHRVEVIVARGMVMDAKTYAQSQGKQ